MTITKGLVPDFGAVGDGVTDNFTALDNFRTFARAQTETVVLNVANDGIYNSTHELPFDGIRNLVVQGSGSGARAKLIGALTFLSGISGFSQKPARTARLYTVLEGATSAFCKTASHALRFTVGHIVAIGAQEWQGASGYPPNLQHLQYVRVTEVNGSSGQVKFEPAANETFYDHYIETGTPGADYDPGGPVTMFVMRDPENGTGGVEYGFDSDVTVNGLSFETDSNQIYCRGRRFVANDIDCTDCCVIPTNGGYIQFNRVDVTGEQMEVDKDVEYFEANDCDLRAIDFQSASVMHSVFNRVTCTNFWHGTGRVTEMYDCTAPDFTVGPNGYGSSERLIVRRCALPDGIGWVTSHKHDAADFTLSNGVLTYTGSGILPFGAEESALFLAGQIVSNFEHIGYTKVITRAYDNGSGEPSHDIPLATLAPSFLTGTVYVVQHPCRDVTLSSLTGDGEIYSDGSANKPLFSYASDTQSFESAELLKAWGVPRIEVEVIRAYTGASSTCTLHLGGKDGAMPKINAGGATGGQDFDFTINAKQPGLRTITTTSISGGKPGDTSTPYGEIWLCHGILPEIAEDISGDTALQKPLIRVTIYTEQGIDPETDDVDDGGATDFLAFHSDHAPVKHYAKLKNVEELVRRVAPEQIPEPTILPRDFFEDVPKKKRRFTIADGFSDA